MAAPHNVFNMHRLAVAMDDDDGHVVRKLGKALEVDALPDWECPFEGLPFQEEEMPVDFDRPVDVRHGDLARQGVVEILDVWAVLLVPAALGLTVVVDGVVIVGELAQWRTSTTKPTSANDDANVSASCPK